MLTLKKKPMETAGINHFTSVTPLDQNINGLNLAHYHPEYTVNSLIINLDGSFQRLCINQVTVSTTCSTTEPNYVDRACDFVILTIDTWRVKTV